MIRLFGSKEGLLAAERDRFQSGVESRRTLDPPVTPRKVADAILVDYEAIGDFILRLLAQEERHPALSGWLNFGRAHHRSWIGEMFSDALNQAGVGREELLNQLIVAYDLYTWKLLRRDVGLSREETANHMAGIAERLTGG